MSENKTAKTPADGGSAFPTLQYVSGISPTGHSVGMTLRDYFAAQAMQGLLMGGYEDITTEYWDSIPKDAYVMADAMLKARMEKNGG